MFWMSFYLFFGNSIQIISLQSHSKMNINFNVKWTTHGKSQFKYLKTRISMWVEKFTKIVLKLTVSVHIRIINFFIASKLGIPWTYLLVCWNITWSRLAEIADKKVYVMFLIFSFQGFCCFVMLFLVPSGKLLIIFVKDFVWKQIKGF
jgi:hypothetical protein